MFLVATFALGGLFALVPTSQAEAADGWVVVENGNRTAQWVAPDKIVYGGQTFVDSNTGDNNWNFEYKYVRDGGVVGLDDCESKIWFNVNPYGVNGGQNARATVETTNGGGAIACSATFTDEALQLTNRVTRCNGDAACVQQAAQEQCGTTGSADSISTCMANVTQQGNTAPTTGGAGSTGGQSAEDSSTGCDFGGNPLTWIICPTIGILEVMIQKVDDFIMSSLTFDTENVFKTDGGYYAAWNSFRVIATSLLVIVGIVMVTSQALGFEFLDAYTIKKVLPRLLIAIIGMTLSWPLMKFAIEFFNTLGTDVRSLIYSPFGAEIQGTLGGSTLFVFNAATIAALVALGPGGILSFLVTAALAVLVGFVIILVRYLAIIVLVVFAPIAIAAFILPNTNKIWDLWRTNFIGLLLVFPIISAFIAIGRVFSAVSLGGGGPDSFAAGSIAQIVGFVAYFLPYFLLPIAFRLATGVIGSIAGFVNDKNRGAFDRLKKYRQNAYATHGGVRMERGKERALQQKYRAYNNLQNASGGRVKRFAARRAAGAIGGFNIESQVSANNAKNAKMIDDQTANGPDNLVRAYTVNKSYADKLLASGDSRASDFVRVNKDAAGNEIGREYRSVGGSWQSEADVLASNRAFGNNNHAAFQKALTYEMGKANTQEEQDHVVSSYGAAAARFGMTQREAGEVWIGSAYAQQNSNRQWKHHKWSTGSDGMLHSSVNGLGMMREIDEKQGNYQMMQQSADTWTTMGQEVVTARQVMDGSVTGDRVKAEETLQRAARIAHATRSGGMSRSPVTGQEGDVTGATTGGGGEVGSGAPGRVMEEMNRFVQLTDMHAGKYTPPKGSSAPPTVIPGDVSEGTINRRSPDR